MVSMQNITHTKYFMHKCIEKVWITSQGFAFQDVVEGIKRVLEEIMRQLLLSENLWSSAVPFPENGRRLEDTVAPACCRLELSWMDRLLLFC